MSWVSMAIIIPPHMNTDPEFLEKAMDKSLKAVSDRNRPYREALRKEEEETARKRENDRLSQQSMNIALGDITGSGIPGGFDLDITTPL